MPGFVSDSEADVSGPVARDSEPRLDLRPARPVRVELTLPYPPSANSYWRSAPGRGLVPSREATAYKRAVRLANARRTPLLGECRVSLVVYRPRRIGDLDNCLKVLFDALKGVAFLDDSQVVEIRATRRDDPTSPRVELVAEGEAFATPEKVAEHERCRMVSKLKRKETLLRRRAENLAP